MRRPSPLPLFQRKRVEWYGYRFLTSTVSLTWTAFTACSPVSLSPSAPFPMGRGIWCTACFHAHVVYRSARRIEDFARNDDTQKTAFPHSNPFLWKGLPSGARRGSLALIPDQPFSPTPFRWKGYPNSVWHTACTLSGPSGHLPHAGKAGDTGIPVPSHQSPVTSHPPQRKKGNRAGDFLF